MSASPTAGGAGRGSDAGGETNDPQRSGERSTRPTTIELVRHGETAEGDLTQPFPLFDGRGDPPLSELGRAQARLVADRLAAGSPCALYVSGLRRALETAQPLAARLGIGPVVEPGFAELRLGDWEAGRYRHYLVAEDPRAVLAFVCGQWDAIPGAEQLETLLRRGLAAIERVAAAHPGGTVVVFTHRILIGVLLAHLDGSPTTSYAKVENASVSTLVSGAGRFLLLRFNDSSHLRASAAAPPERPLATPLRLREREPSP